MVAETEMDIIILIDGLCKLIARLKLYGTSCAFGVVGIVAGNLFATIGRSQLAWCKRASGRR